MSKETYFPIAEIEKLEIGMSASYAQTITEADITIFAGVSGDKNPAHVNEEYASASRYKKRIAHGMISASFFSGILGTKLPGSGCVYAAQNLIFKRAVYIGETVTATVTVTDIDLRTRRVKLSTVCVVKKKKVIDGEAEVFIP
ncbi:MaoC family dehydratase [Geopsychrobacter electrodiphilus]|uniref:MaoC family dehydratase n=1 Tax=Geopsychrobacter electrodiphilus TaxID=225196 RepID=UPI00037D44FF|nr:MaoC family dehydratase [Geopsychrobacter electrodiphilus]